MDQREVTRLLGLILQICPAQRIDEFTADIWLAPLGHYRFVDAVDAVKQLAGTARFIAPVDVIEGIRKIRNDRIDLHGTLIPPDHLDDAGQLEWLRTERRRLGDGLGPGPRPEISADPSRAASLVERLGEKWSIESTEKADEHLNVARAAEAHRVAELAKLEAYVAAHGDGLDA